jgi:Fe(3+) dicitrate transport protein
MKAPHATAGAAVVLACAQLGWAEEPPPTANPAPPASETPPAIDPPTAGKRAEELAREHDPIDVSVFAGRPTARVAGSAHRVGAAELERFEDDNVHRTLMRVPGVYVRGEDGYGLRPNIGLRGASSDRSKKITLMEDGVLFAPAPYSAPAAYYFPLVTRMSAVEVFKGPSSLRYGPNTIGGAINLVTRSIPMGHRFGADLAFGSELYMKQHLHYGYGTKHAGFVVEGVRLRSDGFKRQEGAAPLPYANTGFDKQEWMIKARVNTDPDRRFYHEGRVKLGFAHEVSNETYLGLGDDDFRADPRRRYAATALDRVRYQRTQVELGYAFVMLGHLQLVTTAYRQNFSRAWYRVDGFAGESMLDVLADPSGGRRAVYYEIMKGNQDSTSLDQAIAIANNDRRFVSQGVQLSATWDLPKLGPVRQKLQFGARVHNDSITRFHTQDDYDMLSAKLVRNRTPRKTTEDSVGSALAFSTYLVDEVSLRNLLVTPGFRAEVIGTELADHRAGTVTEGKQRAFLPGIGAHYQIIQSLGVLAGVHQGFSPVSPGQPDGVKPEVAVNYELGLRFAKKFAHAEAIGFFSDYSNLTGECTDSGGCANDQTGDQFNAGRVIIGGLEASAQADVPTPVGLTVPLRASYTFTKTRFLESFVSDNPQWGSVQKGDELPYVPMHQLAVTAGVDWKSRGGAHLGLTYMSSMREVAGQGEPKPFDRTDAFAIVDATLYWQAMRELRVYAKAENLFDNAYVVSHRPFGARPGRPRFLYAGVKIDLD